MTTAERVQAAYAWAKETRDKPRASCTLMYCAGQLVIAVENSEGEWDIGHDNIIDLLREWRDFYAKRRARGESPVDLGKAIELVSIIMGVTGD